MTTPFIHCDFVRKATAIREAAGAWPWRLTKKADVPDIDNGIPVVDVASHVQTRLEMMTDIAAIQARIETNPYISHLDKLTRVQYTDRFYSRIWSNVGIPGSAFNFFEKLLLLGRSPLHGFARTLVLMRSKYYIWRTIETLLAFLQSAICTTHFDINIMRLIWRQMHIFQSSIVITALELGISV